MAGEASNKKRGRLHRQESNRSNRDCDIEVDNRPPQGSTNHTKPRSGGIRVYKIVVLGDGGVGKSAVTLQFVSHSFLDYHDPTIEDSYQQQAVIDGEPALLDILDTAGQVEFTAMRDQYMRCGEGFLICYSVTDRHSFQEASEYKKLIQKVRASEDTPIVLVDELTNYRVPMVAAIYYGDSKPPLTLFFEKFVEEMLELINNGLSIKEEIINIRIKCFVCDTQARSYIKGTPACNAENGSCIKCTVVGEWDARGKHMSYPRIHCPLRTNQSFRNKIDEDHHKEETPLINLPIDMVEDFIVADSLHLIDLGIMRRCLYGWREGSYNFKTKLSKNQADEMSKMLENCNKTKPIEIRRAIRPLKSLKFWKGSEYRVFLLYLGPVVLKDFLATEVYDHFLMLSCAITILSSKEYLKYISIAETLLEDYIETFIELYGIDSISSNVHNLCHVIGDVKKFGILPNISSYIFESYLGQLKSLVRQGNLPLSQVAKRVEEMSSLEGKPISNSQVKTKRQLNEPHDHPLCIGIYEELQLNESFILSAADKNRYFLTKNKDIVHFINATYFDKKLHIFGRKLSEVYDFYYKPFASSRINIFASKAQEDKLSMDPPKLFLISDIKAKLFRVPYHSEYIFFPLLHTLNVSIIY